MPGEPGTATLKQQIYSEIRQSIIMGHRQPGARISIQQLRAQYGTSVTPIREALQMLNQEGLVTIKPHSGYLVTQLTLKQLRDLLDLREILELAAVERAAETVTDVELCELQQSLGDYSGDDDEAYTRYTEENRRFHYLIARATRNRELAEALGHVHDRLARFMVLRRAGAIMKASHERILDALSAHDPQAAKQEMAYELSDAHKVIMDRVIQEQGHTWPLNK